MATFYPTLGNQRDILPASYPGDQKLASYPESLLHSGNIMMYLNQTSSPGSYSSMLPGSSLPLDNCVEIPSVGGRNEMVFIPPTSDTTSFGHLNTAAGDPVGSSVTGDPLDGERNFQSQGLSLSLGTHMEIPPAVSVPPFHYQYMNPGFSSSFSSYFPTSGKGTASCEGDGSNKSTELRNSGCFQSNLTGGNHNTIKAEASNPHMHSGMHQYEPADFADTILNSKYLKEAQELLDEVVNVQNALKQVDSSKRQNIHGIGLDSSKETDKRSSSQSVLSDPIQSNTSGSAELSPAERQDLQNKKTKLFSMLDEVNRRYKQYYHQMQIVVSSFDSIAGRGAAKPYTTLARQTISRHFRCLRDAISGQIQVTRRSLGEQETGIPRLRSVDYQIRQQRALQQLGVMRHAWRPQRGLPESSVSTLRAWLFEHFLHPYPNDSEKIMLARQTGLTRNQVANWFINARVRLWKPMVEEMYKEEFGESEMNSKSLENAPKEARDNSLASQDGGEELQDSTTSRAVDSAQPGQVHDLKSDDIPSVEMNGSTTRMVFQSGFHKDAVMHSGVIQLQDDQRPTIDDHSLMAATGADDMLELSGFGIGGQVSLALGLHHQENDSYPMSGGTHIRGNDSVASSVGPGIMDYHCVDAGKQQHRFGTPHQLHDFVV